MATELDLAVGALLDFRLAEWNGLPSCLTGEIAAILSAPSTASDSHLGAYPALREEYPAPAFPAGGLLVYSRAHRVLVIETAEPPPIEAMETLGQPDIHKPAEFSLTGYFVREFLYCHRGLVFSVAESLDPAAEPRVKIARCRGIRSLAAPHEYGADYYLALRNRVVFASER
jgi:hypothetical protein